jgi:hypothetical protein
VYHVAGQKLESGESVEFGPLQLSQQGISHAGKTLPWKDVAGLRVEFGKLEILTSGGSSVWCKVGVETIPSYEVFQALAGRYITP